MFVARSEWKYQESNEYLGCSKNYDALVAKVIDWAYSAQKEGYADFSNYKSEADMIKSLDDKGYIASIGAYWDGTSLEVEDWVCYLIDEVDEI